MILTTWNVNSIKVRLPHVLAWLQDNPVDILCLQELKLETALFPHAAFEAQGYHALCFGQKTYNGVAILIKKGLAFKAVEQGFSAYPDTHSRVIMATIEKIRVICLYAVNGESLDSPKFEYKKAWYEALIETLKESLTQSPYVAVLGDWNIAPTDDDIYQPEKWVGKILCSPIERHYVERIKALGFIDTFQQQSEADQHASRFTWWDYRQAAFQRNLGARIDHIFLSAALAPYQTGFHIDRIPRGWERPSDHTPVSVTLNPISPA